MTVVFWLATQLTVISKVAADYPYIVLDDARHYVVWLRRLSEPGIYPDDPIADSSSCRNPLALQGSVLAVRQAWHRAAFSSSASPAAVDGDLMVGRVL